MRRVELVPFTAAWLAAIEPWFDHPEVRRRLGDREWTDYEGEGADGPVIAAVDPRRAMGFAFVVAPDRWGQGYGRATLRAMMDHPAVADVRLFVAGIEPDNLASIRSCEAAGFVPRAAQPDWEGIVTYQRER